MRSIGLSTGFCGRGVDGERATSDAAAMHMRAAIGRLRDPRQQLLSSVLLVAVLSGGGVRATPFLCPLQAWNRDELHVALGRRSAPEDPDHGVARHPLALASAYAAITGAEPLYSTSHGQAFTTVDYIWHTPRVRSRRHWLSSVWSVAQGLAQGL